MLNETYIICPICNKSYKELNNFHLKFHKITKEEYDILYPNSPRLSAYARKCKATLINISDETRKNLKYCHTEEAFIKRYGETIGKEKYELCKAQKSKNNKLEGYVERFGALLGLQKWKEDKKNKGVTLSKYIDKYGIEEGTKKHEEWYKEVSYRATVNYFIEKYGEKEGIEFFRNKHRTANDKKRRIHPSLLEGFSKYCHEINLYTSESLRNNKLENIELRGLKHGYSLDHKISKMYGFINNIDSKIIGSIFNLRIVTIKENCSKQDDCVETEYVIEQYNNFLK